jgi:hypothetical protein
MCEALSSSYTNQVHAHNHPMDSIDISRKAIVQQQQQLKRQLLTCRGAFFKEQERYDEDNKVV